MSDASKINASHLRRRAFVYLRQSSAAQVEHNRESTKRQYALASRATELGWSSGQVTVIDEDLGLSGSGAVERSGFARLGDGSRRATDPAHLCQALCQTRQERRGRRGCSLRGQFTARHAVRSRH
jgi:DNA invertase Pin-like site-specific DNA recombinase